MAGIIISKQSLNTDGPRPVRLQTDLPQLADLIETAFSNSMDASGRAAIREMRQLSRVGLGLGVLSNLNELAQGMSLGYVWIANGRIVGNVSVYPADFPRDMGKVWIIANVAVYPEYRGRGIATQLMKASLDMIRSKSGGRAILQVDIDNHIARKMYQKMGFVEERGWIQWYRSPFSVLDDLDFSHSNMMIRYRRPGDYKAEYDLAKLTRPQSRGGLDWLKPTHIDIFRVTLWNRLSHWLNLHEVERLVIRSQSESSILGWLSIESMLGGATRQLLLMTHPDYQEECARVLLGSAMRRFHKEGLSISHPYDDDVVNRVLWEYQFIRRRAVMHMRYDFQ